MTHDFARQRAARNGGSGRNAPAPWGWLLSGVVIGATFSFLVCLALQKPPATTQTRPGQTDTETAKTARTARPATAKTPSQTTSDPGSAPGARPQFDFYDILRDNRTTSSGAEQHTEGQGSAPRTVDVPEPASPPSASAPETTPSPAPAQAAPSTPTATQPAPLTLQAGAFSRPGDADRRRGDLLLLGYQARTETVRLPDGQTRYRVLVGPFADQQALSSARRALRDVGIETL